MNKMDLGAFADLVERADVMGREGLGGLADVWRLKVDGEDVVCVVAGGEALVMEGAAATV